MPVDFWIRAYLLIGMVMLVQSSINVTKTLRDNHEGQRLINRLEDAERRKGGQGAVTAPCLVACRARRHCAT